MPGTYDFTITATDGSRMSRPAATTALVIDCPTITVRPANPDLPPGRVGAPYTGAFTANGGLAPYSFSVSAGALPAGLTLDTSTGVLSGAPATSGIFNFRHPGDRQRRMFRRDSLRPDHQLPDDSNQSCQSESAQRHGWRAFQRGFHGDWRIRAVQLQHHQRRFAWRTDARCGDRRPVGHTDRDGRVQFRGPRH